MAQVTRAAAKGYFNTGDTPTEAQFADLIDSALFPADIDSTPTDGSTNPVSSNGVFDALALKAAVNSPTFTGTPSAPTAAPGTDNTQIATTAFVNAKAAADAIYFDEDSFTGTGTDVDPITGKFPVYNVVTSNVANAHTGNTTETTVFTGTIPAGSIGVNGAFHIIMLIGCTNNANAKTVRLKFNGTTIATSDMASNAFRKNYITIHNRNSASVQVSGAHDSQAQLGTGTSSLARATYAFDTASAITVTATIQLGNAADTVTLEALQIVAYR